MWTYSQTSGFLKSKDGKSSFQCYSGRDDGKNNPYMQSVKATGPIPRGKWKMTEVQDSDTTGRFTIHLAPYPETETFGRTEFRIHGDSTPPGTASHGCIIRSPRADREAIWNSGDRDVMVVK